MVVLIIDWGVVLGGTISKKIWREHTANFEALPVSTWVALEDLAKIPPLPDPGVATPAATALPVGDIGV